MKIVLLDYSICINVAITYTTYRHRVELCGSRRLKRHWITYILLLVVKTYWETVVGGKF